MARPRVESNVRQLDEAEAAYVAACVDCDGYVGVVDNTKFRTGREPKLQISNNSKEFLENIQKVVSGGRLTEHRIRHLRPNHNLQYLLCFRMNEMLDLLPQLVPFLHIKWLRAEKVLELLKGVC